MKKLRKLTVALLAVALLFSLAVPALASVVPFGDPNECPYCGVGSYRVFKTWDRTRVDPASKIPCRHGGVDRFDGMEQTVYKVGTGCSNVACKYYWKDVPTHEEYEDIGWVCLRDYTGMSLGGEVS